MKLTFEEWKRKPRHGWTAYDLDYWTGKVSVCRWYLYPLMQLFCAIRNEQISFYHYLNDIGIMKTPIGNRMVLSDIWKRKRRMSGSVDK